MSWNIVMFLYTLSLLILVIAYMSNRQKPLSEQLKMWGVWIALPFAFTFSLAFGCMVIILVSSGLGIIFSIYVFPIIFIIGVITCVIGFLLARHESKNKGLYSSKKRPHS